MFDHCLGATFRLNDAQLIKNIRLKGERIKVFPFLVYRSKNLVSMPRLAIAITRRAGPSVTRSRFKRFLREMWRTHKDFFGTFDYYFFCAADLTKLTKEQQKLLRDSLLKRLKVCVAS